MDISLSNVLTVIVLSLKTLCSKELNNNNIQLDVTPNGGVIGSFKTRAGDIAGVFTPTQPTTVNNQQNNTNNTNNAMNTLIQAMQLNNAANAAQAAANNTQQNNP